MATRSGQLSDSSYRITGEDNKMYNCSSLLRGALPPPSGDDSWLQFTDRAWFAPCLGEDWVRLAFLRPASAAFAAGSLPSTHSCGTVLQATLACIPSYANLEAVVLPHKNSSDLWEVLLRNFTLPAIDGLDAPVFWQFVARYLQVFVWPRFRRGHRDYPSERGGSLRVHHIRHIGFGVSSVSALRYGDPIDGLWGQLFELAPEDTALLETMNTATKTAKVSGENSKVEFLQLGPLGLANHACPQHSTITPFRDDRERPTDLRTGLSASDYTCAYTDVEKMPRFTPLTLDFGSDFAAEDVKLHCDSCPATGLNIPPFLYTEWLKAINSASKSVMLSRCLAEDWIFLSVLLPLAMGATVNLSHPSAVTHSTGDLRAQIAAAAGTVDVDLLSSSIPAGRNRGKEVEHALADKYQSTLGFLGPLVDWDAFWYHASRWIGCLSLRGANRRGNLVPTWDSKYGLGITALKVPPWDWKRHTQAERPITSVWGEHSPLPSGFNQVVHRIDNQTSRLLMRGNATRQVQFGPLVYGRRACSAHANIIPDSQPLTDSSRDRESGLSTSDFAGAYPEGTFRLSPNDELAYRYSESFSAKDDNFGFCVTCARARDLECKDRLVEEEYEDWGRGSHASTFPS